MIKLYDYFRSSASFRVRIALNIKKVAYEQISVHLVNEGGQHLKSTYAEINPEKLVPCLIDSDETTALSQSLAIIEYLEEQYPHPALLPKDPLARAKVRAFAQHIACEIHPVNNLRVLKYLAQNLQVSEEQKITWYHHWLREGFAGLEQHLRASDTPFCFGDSPTVADICLIPQVYNAERFEFPLDDFPRIKAINKLCLTLTAFSDALPERQADA